MAGVWAWSALRRKDGGAEDSVEANGWHGHRAGSEQMRQTHEQVDNVRPQIRSVRGWQ